MCLNILLVLLGVLSTHCQTNITDTSCCSSKAPDFVSSCPDGLISNILCDGGCNWQWSPCAKPGLCPVLDTSGTCDQKCTNDSSCPGAQKCCSNGCGSACMDVLGTAPNTCTFDSCPRLITQSTQICPDGSTAGTICEKSSSGACQWAQTQCPSIPPSHRGHCPSALCSGFVPDNCTTDDDCLSTEKCCFNGCGRICTERVLDCYVTGMVCDEEPLLCAPSVPDQSPGCLACKKRNFCYRPNSNATCSWSPGFDPCIANCSTITPVKECKARHPCGCQALPGCRWCDVSSEIAVGDVIVPYFYGLCMPATLINKCSASSDALGYSGHTVGAISDCAVISNASLLSPTFGEAEVALSLGLSPNLVDGSGLVTGFLRIAMQKINNGEISETDLQTHLDAYLYTPSRRVGVDNILQALYISKSQTRVQTLIELYNMMEADIDQICFALHQSYASLLGIEAYHFQRCNLVQVMSSRNYLHTSIIVEGSPNTGMGVSWSGVVLSLSLLLLMLS